MDACISIIHAMDRCPRLFLCVACVSRKLGLVRLWLFSGYGDVLSVI